MKLYTSWEDEDVLLYAVPTFTDSMKIQTEPIVVHSYI